MWPICRQYDIAIICYQPIDHIDFSKTNIANVKKDKGWQELYSSQKASITKFAYEMEIGDIIYVKQGKEIVAKGEIRSKYKYELCKKARDEDYYLWPHQRKVIWDNSFRSVKYSWDNQLHTVLNIDYKTAIEIDKLSQSYIRKYDNKKQFEEGKVQKASFIFRKRNRALIEAKKRAMADCYECEICGYNYSETFNGVIVGGIYAIFTFGRIVNFEMPARRNRGGVSSRDLHCLFVELFEFGTEAAPFPGN
jgi:hypothetical protein